MCCIILYQYPTIFLKCNSCLSALDWIHSLHFQKDSARYSVSVLWRIWKSSLHKCMLATCVRASVGIPERCGREQACASSVTRHDSLNRRHQGKVNSDSSHRRLKAKQIREVLALLPPRTTTTTPTMNPDPVSRFRSVLSPALALFCFPLPAHDCKLWAASTGGLLQSAPAVLPSSSM